MATIEVKFEKAPRITVAYVEMRGPYSSLGDAMKSLKKWIDAKGFEQAGYPFCVFYDDPKETAEADLRSEACIPVSKMFEAEGGYRSKELVETEVAETKHEGPPEELSSTYGPLIQGLLKQGYAPVGPAREYYMSPADVKGPGTGFLIQQPVSKK